MNQAFLPPDIADTFKMGCLIFLDLIYSTLQNKMKQSSLQMSLRCSQVYLCEPVYADVAILT